MQENSKVETVAETPEARFKMTPKKRAEFQDELDWLFRRRNHCQMWFGLRLGIIAESANVERKIANRLGKAEAYEVAINSHLTCVCGDCRSVRVESQRDSVTSSSEVKP